MKVKVDEDLCAGCGPCEDVCPEVFEVVDDMAKVKMDVVPPELEEKCREAVESCPSEALIIEQG